MMLASILGRYLGYRHLGERSVAVGTLNVKRQIRWYSAPRPSVRRNALSGDLQSRRSRRCSGCPSSIGISGVDPAYAGVAGDRRPGDAASARMSSGAIDPRGAGRRRFGDGLFGARWGGAQSRASRRVGARRASLRHVRFVVLARRRSLYRVYVHRRPGAGLRRRCARILRRAVCHDRLSNRVRRARRAFGRSRGSADTSPPPTSFATASVAARSRLPSHLPASLRRCRISRCSWSA